MGWWTIDRKRYALNYLLNAGLSLYGAAGLVSRWANVESTANGPTSINPYSGAFGIAQWLGPRLPGIRGNTNFDAQLQYVVIELAGPERVAADALRSANSVQSGAVAATMYERAENYNKGRWAGTNQDDYTAKTAQGIPAIVALRSPVVQQSDTLNPIIPAPGIFDWFDSDLAIASNGSDIAGVVKTASFTGIAVAVAATVLIVYLVQR